MLDEEDFRAALKRVYRQGPDGVEAGQVASKDAGQVTQSVRIRSYDDLVFASTCALARYRILWVCGITAIGSGLGQDAASRTVALPRPDANKRSPCTSGGAFSPAAFIAGWLAHSYFTKSSKAMDANLCPANDAAECRMRNAAIVARLSPMAEPRT